MSSCSVLRSEDDPTKPHVLAMPFPAQGHVTPMMRLCKKMAADGFTITFVNIDSIHEQMKRHWVATQGIDIRFESIPFSWSIPKGFDAYCMENVVSFLEATENLSVGVEELIDRMNLSEDTPGTICCLLTDYFLPWTQKIANKHQVPRVALWPGWSTLEFHIPELVSRGHVPAKASDIEENEIIIDYVPGLSPFRPADVPMYLHIDVPEWIQMTVMRAPVVAQASWVLVDSFYELEPETFKAMRDKIGERFVPAGPLFLLEDEHANVGLRGEDSDCIEWLDKQAPQSVLYISFGSIAVLSVEQFEELAAGIESLKQPFLWVIRPELIMGDKSAEELYIKSFRERTEGQGFITSWSPQVRVLAHNSVGGFLTHCGWNSMLESIANGVPMLGWPWAAEQNFNCKLMVEDWKIGMRFNKASSNGLIEKDEIKRMVRLLMQGAELRERAREMRDASRRAVQDGGCVSSFMKELKKLNSHALNKASDLVHDQECKKF